MSGSEHPVESPDTADAAPVRLTLYPDPSVPSRWQWLSMQAGTVALSCVDPDVAMRFAPGTPAILSVQDYDDRILAEVTGRVAGRSERGLSVDLNMAEERIASRLQALFNGTAMPVNSDELIRSCRSSVTATLRDGLPARSRTLLENSLQYVRKLMQEPWADVSGMPAKLAESRLQTLLEPLTEAFVQQACRFWSDKHDHGFPEPTRGLRLRLVDDEEMQVWLARAEAARLLERESDSAWRALLPLLRSLESMSPQLEPELLSVDSLMDALVRACREVGMEPNLQRVLFRVASRSEVMAIDGLYALLERELLRCGLQPVRGIKRWNQLTDAVRSQNQTGTTAQQRDISERIQAPTRARFSGAQANSGAGVASDTALSALDKLWNLRREVLPASDPETALASSPPDDGELLDAVRAMSSSVAEQVPAREYLAQVQQLLGQTGQTSPHLDARQTQALEMIAWLRESIDMDSRLSTPAKHWSRALMTPVLATQLQAEGLTNSAEGLRALFEMLEFGGSLCGERDDKQAHGIRDRIDELVEKMAALPTLQPEQVEQGTRQLEQLLLRHRIAAHAIEERVVQTCVGQQRLLDARLIVQQELCLMFEGRQVPAAFAGLLEERLLALLVLVVLRHGGESEDWQQIREQLIALDRALRAAADGRPELDAGSHLDWIRSLVATSASDQAAVQLSLAELEDCLRGEAVAWQEFDPGERLPEAVLEAHTDPHDGDPHSRQLRMLQVGDCLIFATDPEPRLLKLAWHSSERKRFVFVSQLGHKAADLSRVGLLEMLRSEQARLVEDGHASIVERSWRRMVQSLHGELAEQVMRDSLTGLINRKELDRRLTAWVNGRQRPPLAVLWIGVDHMRVLNESKGMAAGDQALRTLAEVIQALACEYREQGGFAARVAGDEFVLVVPHTDPQQAEKIAQTLLLRIQTSAGNHSDHSLRLSASIGISAADESCSFVDSLMTDAERACRAAKQSGRGRIYLHRDDDFRLAQMRETVSWVSRVEAALNSNQLVLFGQRALSLSERACTEPDYLEVLLRMKSEDDLVSPERFIIAAERYGQIAAVDRFVLRSLKTQLQSVTPGSFRIAFNLSAHNIVDASFVEEIIAAWSGETWSLDQLYVELTETAAIEHLAEAQLTMQTLSEAGLHIALDDFGSGWASYQYLKRLPCDLVKIDGSLIRDIASNPQDYALARSVNELAHVLGKRTLAEHIENQQTLDCVREIGFDYAQGYFIDTPRLLSEYFD